MNGQPIAYHHEFLGTKMQSLPFLFRISHHNISILRGCLLLGLIGGMNSQAIADDRNHVKDAEIIRASLVSQFQELFDGMSSSAKQGYYHLVTNVYLPHDFDEEVLQRLDNEEMPSPFPDVLETDHRREATFLRFGLSGRPDEPLKPLQYVSTPDSRYAMNCFACHGGNTYGATYPGAPNTLYALESLTENVRRVKLKMGKPLAHMELGSLFMPLGTSVGTSNAVMFGVALMNFRDRDLNVHSNRAPAAMNHHDMDAPPWWHFHRKHHIYMDGFAEKGHRGLMQFMLVRQNGPDRFRSWEQDFKDVYAFLEELRPPKYPLPVDGEIAARGERIFSKHCSSCHGSYGNQSTYPEILVGIDDIKTDRTRLESLTPEHRKHYGESWFAHYGKQDTIEEVDGYIAPPLDGIWASAPYFHNGSVPTLWHLLHPEERPIVWRRTHLSFDTSKVGLQIESLDKVPNRLKPEARRRYFDTQLRGKSSSGHDYPNALSETEREELLEYLKTL